MPDRVLTTESTGLCSWLFPLPLDFQKEVYVRAAIAPFGRVLEWYQDTNKSRILVQALIVNLDRVPRSLVVSCGTMIGGMERSQSVPVYILNGNFPDAFPTNKDLVPFDGEPHPEHGPIVFGEPNWQNELQGAAGNLGFFGANPHSQPHQHNLAQHNMQQQNGQGQQADNNGEDMEVDEGDVEWPAWNPQIFMVDNAQPVPQHPYVPQDHLDLNMSGSSMHFLRGEGPDLSLDKEFQAITDEDSSSSSDASSTLVEERACFVAAQSRCANILIFGRKDMPRDVFIRGSSLANPIIIDKSVVQIVATQPVTRMEIVPWKPVKDAIAMQLYPAVDHALRAAKKAKSSGTPLSQ